MKKKMLAILLAVSVSAVAMTGCAVNVSDLVNGTENETGDTDTELLVYGRLLWRGI